MSKLLSQLWNDDEGAVISVELILVLGILIFGIIPGLVALRNSVVAALVDVGNALSGVIINVSVDGLGVGDAGNLSLTQGIAGVGGFNISQAAGGQLQTVGVPATSTTAITSALVAPPTLITFPKP